MNFNTAIFYDIENLMGGYKKENLLPFLSLKDISKTITEQLTGKVAVQRAYANWNTPRLNILSDDMIQLGIDPIQMFGFGRGPDQNASDIQLAIDVMELVFQHEKIDTFVIVSGDGGFSALAKKLHKYGKTVIGCSYPRITSKVLEGVCDRFISLDDPLAKAEKVATIQARYIENNRPVAAAEPALPEQDSVITCFKKEFFQLAEPDHDQIFYEAKCILEYFAQHDTLQEALQGKDAGVNITIYGEVLKYRLGSQSYPFLGFNRHVDFLRYIVNDSPCKLVWNKAGLYRLLFKSTDCPADYELVKAPEDDDNHTADYYRVLLKKSDAQLFIFPSPLALQVVVRYMVENHLRFQNSHIKSMLALLQEIFDYPPAQLRAVLVLLQGLGCFEEQEGEVLHVNLLSFVPENEAAAVQQIREAIHVKLFKTLGYVDADAFNELLPVEWHAQDDLQNYAAGRPVFY